MGLSSVNGAPINALPGRDPGKAIPLSGTSFATAYTSGVAALVRAKYPQLSAHQIIRRITETAHNPPRGVDNKVGYGVVDPVAALTFDVPPGDRLPPEHLTNLLHVPAPPPAAGSAAAAHRADRCRGRGRAGRGGRRGRGGSTEAVMKARTVGINATIPAVVGVEVAVIAAILIFPPGTDVVVADGGDGRWSPRRCCWSRCTDATSVRWLVDRFRWRRRRRRTDSPAAAIDIPHGASLYGVRVPDRFDGEAITMIEVTGQAYSPTLLTGSATALTPNRLPLDALTDLLDQPGGIGCPASTWCPAGCACDAAPATRRCTPLCWRTVRPRVNAEPIWWCASTSPTRSAAWRTARQSVRPPQRPPSESSTRCCSAVCVQSR